MRYFLRTKRMTHVLVNNIFYFIVFILGFMLGGGSIEKVKIFINDVINVVLS